MLLLFDIGNTHTHLGWAGARRVVRQADVPTVDWKTRGSLAKVRRFARGGRPTGVVLCSVVPQATPLVRAAVDRLWGLRPVELGLANVVGVGVDYPQPETIGPDRLANAMAARAEYGAPVIVLDFGTAVTFDVVDARGNYVGGVIAPGLAAMTDYLHEKTALLPRIRIREVRRVIGRSTEEAMLVGAVHGYRGLVQGLIRQLKAELGAPRLPVVATGGYARLMARGLPEITSVRPNLTLEGLRLLWMTASKSDFCRLSGGGAVRRLRGHEPD